MNRPLILRMLPPRFRPAIASRFYCPICPRLHSLFDGAPLYFAPGVAMKLVAGDVISDVIALTGFYDLDFTRWLIDIAKREGGLFVEVGAHLGYYSLIWCAQRQDNQALAFEPSPRNVELLRHNVFVNSFSDRIAVRDEAVGRCRGKMRFKLGRTDQNGWGGFVTEASSGIVDVDVVTLDEALSAQPEITVLKVNIQGADLWALQGADRILREQRARHVWFQENKPRMRSLGIEVGEPPAFMRGVGYQPVAKRIGMPANVDEWYAQPRHNSS